ncbi:hypothetical protein B277_01664 [Janibacter hoylei PVAS-1]|uniref:Integral membrane protein n=1 Tax=Janibacter hoylei PVAS-1 TaxID=1210046 RepID=K1EAT1_9MICO|nr:hypothetical protein [Janibacter hoylei]EKA62542.1 hypothetical protein B277_01664 [Janibacter hoylei PVAS-1]RWU84712.1 hypothetical protein CWN80_03805 [Janibacter hoylei PVAS-1]
MDALHLILYILHMLAMLAIVVGPAVPGRGHLVQVWGARLQLLIGLGLTGLAEAGDDPVNHAKIGTKLVIMIAVLACAEIGNAKAKRGEAAASKLAWAAAGLAVVNAAIAFLW